MPGVAMIYDGASEGTGGGEVALWLAVIQQALDDAVSRPGQKYLTQHEIDQARLWLAKPHLHGPVLDALGIDREFFRDNLPMMLERARARKASRRCPTRKEQIETLIAEGLTRPCEIEKETGLAGRQVANTLAALLRDGRVERVSEGQYAVLEAAQ